MTGQESPGGPGPGFVDNGDGHVVILHRWQDAYATYEEYVDHRARPVTYITPPGGRATVPASAAEVHETGDLDDYQAVLSAVAASVQRHGAPAAIIALKESDLPVASRLREWYGTPGRRPGDLSRFLDKLEMAECVQRLGLPLPEYAPVRDTRDVEEFAARHGWPVVVKPRRGSSSRGVVVLRDRDRLAEHTIRPEDGLMVQAFQQGTVLHVDGLLTPQGLGPWRASAYLDTCLAFAGGAPMGSVELDDRRLLAQLEQYLEKLIPGLEPTPWTFHLEVFMDDSDPEAVVFTFLEVGARVGGGEVSWLWREVHGIDLMWTECAMQFGHLPDAPPLAPDEPVAGFLLYPLPVARPCRVTRLTPVTAGPDGPYAVRVPQEGEVLPEADGAYEHTGGRFRFKGKTTAEVRGRVERATREFEIHCVPLAADPEVRHNALNTHEAKD
ncbi:biotin carboxylase [Streptomyces sp. NPDC040750]|uniref:ATP-grasp domain-containing protein n=1 Tax=Streptomyces sp. NPDC040750 TaxID=3154491 RepID=UPI00340354DF